MTIGSLALRRFEIIQHLCFDNVMPECVSADVLHAIAKGNTFRYYQTGSWFRSNDESMIIGRSSQLNTRCPSPLF